MLSLFRRFFSQSQKEAVLPAAGGTDEALRVLFENGAAGISEVDLSSRRFVRVNRRFCEIMRRPASQLLRMGPAEVIHPEDLQATADAWLSAMAGTGQWDATVRHHGPLGETIWVRLGVSLYKRDENGDPARCIAVVQDISESVVATEKLRESEQLLRLGQQVGRIGSFCRDLTTQLITCSSQTREILGLPAGDGVIPAELWLASVVPEDRERFSNTVNAALASHAREIAFEYRLHRFDGGGARNIEMRVRYHYDAEGRPLRSMGVVIDVTERKQAEVRLRASETLLRLGMKVGGIGAYKRDYLRGDEIDCGPETRALHGLPEGDEPIPAAIWLESLLPEDAERVDAEIRAAQDRRQQEYCTRYRLRLSSDGPVRHMEARAHLDYDSEGRPVSAVGVVIDVTDRREAEQLLAHAARHDALTGLPNRTFFRERMDEALARARRGEQFALLCLDLDRFKEVNDTLGHGVGDLLLIEASVRLRAELRDVDTLARLGGDEL